MSTLNREWSLNYIFYFLPIQDLQEVLIVSSHPERAELNFNLFDFNVTHYFPKNLKPYFNLMNYRNIEFFDTENFSLPKREVDLIIFDLNIHLENKICEAFLHNLKNDGFIVVLDWFSSKKETIKKLFWHFGIYEDNKKNLHERVTLKLCNIDFILDWYLLVEPSLSKPRILVRRSFKTSIPNILNSNIKNFLTKIGIYYLQPHHKLLIGRKLNANGGLDALSETIQWLVKITDSIKKVEAKTIRRILVSSTKILILDVDLGKEEYIVRFPLGQEAHKRLTNQNEILNKLSKNGIRHIPVPVKQNKEIPFQYFIEKKIKGENNKKKLIGRKANGVLFLYNQVMQEIEQIHLKFGRRFKMNREYFSKFIEPKFELLMPVISKRHDLLPLIERMRNRLLEEFLDKVFIAGICHGDLKIANCIFGKDGYLKGIIDWDMSEQNGIVITDIATLLSSAIREKYFQKEILKDFMLNIRHIPVEFLPSIHSYFEHTETSTINPKILILFYWIDRVSKLIKYNKDFPDMRVQKEIAPVLKNLDAFLAN